MFSAKSRNRDTNPEPYEYMTYHRERGKVDVKVVPKVCVADPDMCLFQYTAIDEITRLQFMAAYQEQSIYSFSYFLRKLRA